jgi:hypothetical protein
MYSTLAVIAAIGVIYVALPIMADVYFRFRRRRTVTCPETGLAENVQVDAWHAAATAMPGPPDVDLTSCTAWPKRAGCEQRCMASSTP